MGRSYHKPSPHAASPRRRPTSQGAQPQIRGERRPSAVAAAAVAVAVAAVQGPLGGP